MPSPFPDCLLYVSFSVLFVLYLDIETQRKEKKRKEKNLKEKKRKERKERQD